MLSGGVSLSGKKQQRIPCKRGNPARRVAVGVALLKLVPVAYAPLLGLGLDADEFCL